MSLLDDLLGEAIQARIDRAVADDRARAAQHEALQRERQRRRDGSLDGRVLAGLMAECDAQRRRRS